MGLEILFWIWVLTWMTKTAATDVLHAVKGTPNPRYELKKQRAVKAGQPVKGQARYGGREWFADLYSDGLAAHTEKRRKSAKANAQPVDDMIGILREPRPATRPGGTSGTRVCPRCTGEVPIDGPCPYCLADREERERERQEAERKKLMTPIGDFVHPTCVRCRATYAQPGSANCTDCDIAAGNYSTSTNGTRPALRLVLPTDTQGDDMSMSAETHHIQATRRYFADLDDHVKTQILPGLEQCAAILAGKGMDPEVVGKVHAVRDRFNQALAQLADALTTHDEKNKLMEQGVNNTEQPAEVGYYKHQ